MKRLGLLLEVFVLTEEFSPLFSEEELAIAIQRLADLGFYD